MAKSSSAAACLLLAIAAQHAAAAGRLSLRSTERAPVGWAPPEPVGEAAKVDKDGAFGSKADACSACKFAATGSCAMYKTCICHATNTFFGTAGVATATDKDNWHWACSSEGGPKYEACFPAVDERGQDKTKEVYMDAFNDPVDPNSPKCPE